MRATPSASHTSARARRAREEELRAPRRGTCSSAREAPRRTRRPRSARSPPPTRARTPPRLGGASTGARRHPRRAAPAGIPCRAHAPVETPGVHIATVALVITLGTPPPRRAQCRPERRAKVRYPGRLSSEKRTDEAESDAMFSELASLVAARPLSPPYDIASFSPAFARLLVSSARDPPRPIPERSPPSPFPPRVFVSDSSSRASRSTLFCARGWRASLDFGAPLQPRRLLRPPWRAPPRLFVFPRRCLP